MGNGGITEEATSKVVEVEVGFTASSSLRSSSVGNEGITEEAASKVGEVEVRFTASSSLRSSSVGNGGITEEAKSKVVEVVAMEVAVVIVGATVGAVAVTPQYLRNALIAAGFDALNAAITCLFFSAIFASGLSPKNFSTYFRLLATGSASKLT